MTGTHSGKERTMTLPGPKDWDRVERIERERTPRLARLARLATSGTDSPDDGVTYHYRVITRLEGTR
jgi:hypothetical protein